MRTFKLRKQLSEHGLYLLQHGDKWLVTDMSIKPFVKTFDCLTDVEEFLAGETEKIKK
jgi:hypothetical protein